MEDEQQTTSAPAEPPAQPAPRPVSILQTLGILPSGQPGPTLALDELGHYLAKHCNDEASKERERRHILRDALVRDGGRQRINTLLEQTFTDKDVRAFRERWVDLTRFSNPSKRISNQLSTIYAEPAEREIDGTDEEKARFAAAYDALNVDEELLEASRMLNLHRAIVLGVRVRVLPDGTREPVLECNTPSTARPVLHPNDAKLVIGWLIRQSHRPARATENQASTPTWTLWTDFERVSLREDFSPIGGTYVEHKFGVCPYFGVALGASRPGFFAGEDGEDITSAHLMTWFSHVLLAKEEKSATKVAAVTGDGTTTARGQGLDTEIPSELPEGSSMTVHDLSMNLEMFQKVADHVLTHVGLNHEIPPALLTHQGTQSAEARDLLRLPMKQLRKQQAIPWRRAEHRLAVRFAAVLKVDLPALWFDPKTFRVRFVESETPLDPVKEHELFEKRRASGHDNSLDHMRRLRPGITEEQAAELVQRNIKIEVERNKDMRPLQAISGSLGASMPPAAPPTGPNLRSIVERVLQGRAA